MSELDLTDFFAERERERLRAAGFVLQGCLTAGEYLWRLPDGPSVLVESEALKWLERTEREAGKQ